MPWPNYTALRTEPVPIAPDPTCAYHHAGLRAQAAAEALALLTEQLADAEDTLAQIDADTDAGRVLDAGPLNETAGSLLRALRVRVKLAREVAG